jgi:hypothetical protein
VKKMRKLGLLAGALLLVVSLLIGFAAPASAQTYFSVVHGDVTIDGAPAPVGRVIDAYVGAELVRRATTTVTTAGVYSILIVGSPGDVGVGLRFKVDGLDATETPAAVFQLAPQEVDLAAVTGPIPPTVTTSAATSITNNSATLNGNLTGMGGYAGGTTVQVRFNWGTTAACGTPTPWVQRTTTGPFSATISPLTPSTNYFFKAQAQGLIGGVADGAIVEGAVLQFITSAGPPWPFVKSLVAGWNILSTPVWLASTGDQVMEIVSTFTAAYRWTGAAWQQIGTTANNPVWGPLEAFYVQVPAGATATFNPSTERKVPATRTLTANQLALVGSSPAFDGAGFPATPVTDVLSGVLNNFVNAVAPALGQPSWSYVPGAVEVPNVAAFGGFWVFVGAGGNRTLVGFATTPLVP